MTIRELLDKAILGGANVSDFIARWNAAHPPDAKALRCIEHARATLVREGELEIDATIASGSEDAGEYILAWVWVEDPHGSPDREEPCDCDPLDTDDTCDDCETRHCPHEGCSADVADVEGVPC